MAVTTKNNWSPSSIPTAGDFNRIENNIAELNSSKESKISVLPVSKGGTGASTVAAARNALGLGNTAYELPIANGGTGASSVASARANLGLGDAAVLNMLSGPCDESGGKIATFKSYVNDNGWGYVLFENGILINWGKMYLKEDNSATITFLSSERKVANYSKNNSGRIAGAILTGMESLGNDVGYNQNRNGVFSYTSTSTSVTFYNDGKDGNLQWMVIGRKA